MLRVIEEVAEAGLGTVHGFDQVIDVRSPSEFAHDHLPGAVNLPVLDDAERARVGAVYVQKDPFLARRLGAALVARNIAGHLEGALAGRGGGWRPLLYCWRGGQRSHAMATVLEQVGWRPGLLRGGYKTYRRGVVRALYEGAPLPGVVLLAGGTGVGKTELLARLAATGVQTLDLEGLAAHRGSLLGALPGRPQPSQKMFESRLAAEVARLDPTLPVVVEAESSKVGELSVPPRLWSAMGAAPTIAVEAGGAARVRRLLRLYGDRAQDGGAFADALARLPRHIGRERVERWRALLAQGALARLAAELIAEHYDPAYARGGEAGRPALGAVSTGEGGDADLARAAEAVTSLLGRASLSGAGGPA